jgi:hypothetical protein
MARRLTAEIVAFDSQCYRFDGFTDRAAEVGQWLVDTLLRVDVGRSGVDMMPQISVRISKQEAACAVEGCGGD